MDSFRVNKFLFVTSVFSILILAIGGTLSFFTVSNKSKYDAVKVEADKIQLALAINPIYTGHKLIPANDEDILDMTAYNNKCVDINGMGACLAYDLEITNFNGNQDMIGKIDFDIKGIDNLSYIVLDESKNVYLEKTSVNNGKTENMPMGEHFLLNDATETKPTKRNFTLIIWLTNIKEEDQTDFDASGLFTASVSYESVTYGSKLTGTVYGVEENPESENTGGDLT